MLTIPEISGLIAAGVMLAQYTLPATLVVVLVRTIGSENTAATWSSVNRTISNTVWPLILRADSVGVQNRPHSATALSWTITAGALLLAVASVVTPLGLSDEIITQQPGPVHFQYINDHSIWGKSTMARPEQKFGRMCIYWMRINCPGQYQGVDQKWVSKVGFESVLRDNSSTVNSTLPANYTAMFSSATDGTTVSGLFDIQYRSWRPKIGELFDHGQPVITGHSRYIENRIPSDDILLIEGLIVDMRENPGIGFRNHTIPIDIEHGGRWSEDLAWLEPVTSCVDTNLTIENSIVANGEGLGGSNKSVFIIDTGAFRGLDISALETGIWDDEQSLDLFGRAYKAARMHNVLIADALNISIPLNIGNNTIPKIEVVNNKFMFGNLLVPENPEIIQIGGMEGMQSDLAKNWTIPTPKNFTPKYPDGRKKLFASNFTAIEKVCRGFDSLQDTLFNFRSPNITNPAVACGVLFGAAHFVSRSNESTAPSMDGGEVTHRKMYVRASGIRSGVKTVDFKYNGTNGQLSNLEVLSVSDKVFPEEQLKPLWAVEQNEHYGASLDHYWTFDPLWGIVNESYKMTQGFDTMRSEKLWLPTIVSGSTFDSLAAVHAPAAELRRVYPETPQNSDYSGDRLYPLVERFGRLSVNMVAASQIPSLIITDSLASLLVGTKTAIRSNPVGYPAMLSVNDQLQGTPLAAVASNRRVVHYDMRFAIPAIFALSLLTVALLWAVLIAVLTRGGIISSLRDMYNQTLTGRLCTAVLFPGRSDPNEASSMWVKGDGKLILSFGRFGNSKSDYFLTVADADGGCGSIPEYQPERPPTVVPETKENPTVQTALVRPGE